MDNRSTSEKVTGAISWTVIPRLIQLAASMFTSILVVRSLGKYDYGTLSVLRPVLIISVVIIGFGMGQALNRFIPELRVLGDRRGARALLLRSLWLQSIVWFALCLLLLLSRTYLLDHFPTYADLLILGVGLCATEVAAGTFNQYAIASYRTGSMALATSIGALFQALGTAALLYVGWKVPGVLAGTAIGYGMNTATLAYLLWRGRPRGPEAAPPEVGRRQVSFPWRRFLGYALPWIPNYTLTYVVWRQSETFLLGMLRNREEAGLFDLAYKLPQLVLEFLPGSVYPLVLAGFAETATVARERMGQVILNYYRLLFFVVAPLSVLGLAMGDVILVRMYGEAMAEAGPYCQVFFVIFTLSFFGTPLSMTVYVVEKVWVNLLLNIGYAVVTLGLDLILIPRYGLLGATIPTGLVTALTPFVRYAIAKRYMDRIEIPWAFIGRVYLASAPLLVFWWIKTRVDSLTTLALALAAAALLAFLCYRLFRVLGPAERDFLGRSRFPGKRWILRLL